MPDAYDVVAASAVVLDRLAPGWWRASNLEAVTAGDLTAVTPNYADMPTWLREKLPALGLVELPDGPTAAQLAEAWAARIANRRANRGRCPTCGQEFIHAVTPDGQAVRLAPWPLDSREEGGLVLKGDVDERPTVVYDGDTGPRHLRHHCPELPKAAAQLLDTARAAGWALLAVTHYDSSRSPYLKVQVAHPRPGDRPWIYEITWHTRGTGTYRLFGRVMARTPDRPAPHDGPSVRAIRALIEANPATEANRRTS